MRTGLRRSLKVSAFNLLAAQQHRGEDKRWIFIFETECSMVGRDSLQPRAGSGRARARRQGQRLLCLHDDDVESSASPVGCRYFCCSPRLYSCSYVTGEARDAPERCLLRIFACSVDEEVEHTHGVAHFVVIPRDDFVEVAVERDTSGSVEVRRVGGACESKRQK